jgi:hypothetical protein
MIAMSLWIPAHTDQMVDEFHREYERAQSLLAALQQCLEKLDLDPEWSGSLQRLVRELNAQLEHAADQNQAAVTERHRFHTRPQRLR